MTGLRGKRHRSETSVLMTDTHPHLQLFDLGEGTIGSLWGYLDRMPRRAELCAVVSQTTVRSEGASFRETRSTRWGN